MNERTVWEKSYRGRKFDGPDAFVAVVPTSASLCGHDRVLPETGPATPLHPRGQLRHYNNSATDFVTVLSDT